MLGGDVMECKQMSRPIVYQLGSCQSRSRAIAEAFPTTFFTKLFDGAVFYYYYYYYYYYLNQGKTPGNSKITKRWWKVFGSGPYSGRSSSIKPSCSKTELNRCTTTEIRWNKNEEARTSPVLVRYRGLHMPKIVHSFTDDSELKDVLVHAFVCWRTVF